MKNEDFIARASTTVNASADKVWKALTDRASIKEYMFGTDMVSDFKKGSPITWKGEWEGRAYEDKGEVLDVEPNRLLRYTHFSPLTGEPDIPENYHTVTIELKPNGSQTDVSLSQDNNRTEDARDHSRKNWEMMLGGLKTFVEK